MASTVNTTFFQLAAAFFVAFLLAHMTTKYFERFERFPSPLVEPGPSLPAVIQGRDYIPTRNKPTIPPGPPVPLAVESDGQLYETVPPEQPRARYAAAALVNTAALPPASAANALLSESQRREQALAMSAPTQATPPPVYGMTRDNYFSGLDPLATVPMTTMSPERQGLVAMGTGLATLAMP